MISNVCYHKLCLSCLKEADFRFCKKCSRALNTAMLSNYTREEDLTSSKSQCSQCDSIVRMDNTGKLRCNHSICEDCKERYSKHGFPIKCRICEQVTSTDSVTKLQNSAKDVSFSQVRNSLRKYKLFQI